jgi:hypothetical protein
MATYRIFTSNGYEFLVIGANELEAKNQFIVKVIDEWINDRSLNYGEIIDISEQSVKIDRRLK